MHDPNQHGHQAEPAQPAQPAEPAQPAHEEQTPEPTQPPAEEPTVPTSDEQPVEETIPSAGPTATVGPSGMEAEGTAHGQQIDDPADSSPTDAAEQLHEAPDANQPGDLEPDPETEALASEAPDQPDEVDQQG